MAIRVLSRVIAALLSGNSSMPRTTPTGMPTRDAKTINQPATTTDVPTAENTSLSREKMRASEVANESWTKGMALFLPVHEENRVAMDPVTGDDPLPFRPGDEVDKFQCQVILDVGMPLRVHGNDPVGIEQPLFPFEEDFQIGLAVF